MPTLERITIYPVKSLEGVDLETVEILPAGALANDRRWQLVDLDGRVVNAKRTPAFHAIAAAFDLSDGAASVRLGIRPEAVPAAAIPGAERLAALPPESFPLVPGPAGPCGWLSAALGVPVLLVERRDGGFPDDRDAPGPTLVSTATLAEVGRWFGLPLDETRRRFRANLEVAGCEAFWEDTLASPLGPGPAPSWLDLPPEVAVDPYADLPPPEPLAFAVGRARLRATNVCRRCAVPGRDSRTGAVTERFRDAFEARRRRGLRADVDAAEWGTLYRLAINTRVETAAVIAVGDGVGT